VSTPSPELLRRIHSLLTRRLEPVKPLPSEGRLAGGILAVCCAVLAAGACVAGVNGWHALSMSRKFGLFAPLAAGAGSLALALARQMVPASRSSAGPAAGFGGSLLACAVAVGSCFVWRVGPDFVRGGIPCLSAGVTWAALSSLAYWRAVKRGAFLSPAWTGATAGALAGLTGAGVLGIHCPDLNGAHILVWHGSVLVVCVLIGTAVALMSARDSTGR